jgi:hypothetical protein
MIFWADGFCIGQDNDKEKGHQIRLMSHIYERADLIIAYLGAEAVGARVLGKSQSHEFRPGWKQGQKF